MSNTLSKDQVISTLEEKVLKWSEFGSLVLNPAVSMVSIIGFVIDEGVYHHDEQLATMFNSCDFDEAFRQRVKMVMVSAISSFENVINALKQ